MTSTRRVTLTDGAFLEVTLKNVASRDGIVTKHTLGRAVTRVY